MPQHQNHKKENLERYLNHDNEIHILSKGGPTEKDIIVRIGLAYQLILCLCRGAESRD
jgi:hypothetical protein